MKKKLPINTIIHTNCIEGMQELPDECIPLVVTSPPYGTMRTYGDVTYGPSEFQAIARQLARILMPFGVICWVVRNQVEKKENCQAEREKLFFVDELGLWAHQTIIGVPKGFPMTNSKHKRYSCNFDYIYVLSKGKPRYVHVLRDRRNKDAGKTKRDRLVRNPDGTERLACGGNHRIPKWGHRSNVWSYATMNSSVTKDHPARMPHRLAEDLIISFSKADDLVFDPMAGSGTTLRMALMNQRKYLGMEANGEYVEMAHRSLKEADEFERPERIHAFLKRFAA